MNEPYEILRELPRLTFYRGRVALYALLKGLGVGPGDDVVTQAFTCVAVPEGIMATGATPVFADVARGQANASAPEFAAALTPATKAVIVQHTFGIPADLDPILTLAKAHGLPVIEDCCHTYASQYRGSAVGLFGIGSFYSFEWGKPLVCGLGGSAVTTNHDLFMRVEAEWRAMREPSSAQNTKINLQYQAYCALYRPERYWKLKRMFHRLSERGIAEGNTNATDVVSRDFSLRMARSARQRLPIQIERAAAIADHASRTASYYDGQIHSTRVEPIDVPEGATPVYARYPLRVADKSALLARAEEASVEIADWYASPVHPLPPANWAGVGYRSGSCPRAEELSQQLVSLPTNMRVSQNTIDRTVALLNGY